MLAFAAAFDIRINWMGKHALFFPPLGWVLRFMGGIPIVRHKSTNVVAAMISSFADRQELVLVVPVEGTRALADFWKSGFYHIARGAGVPIVPSYLDFAAKRGGFGAAIEASGNIDKDMQYLRDFYAPMQGKHPALSGPIRLREESAE